MFVRKGLALWAVMVIAVAAAFASSMSRSASNTSATPAGATTAIAVSGAHPLVPPVVLRLSGQVIGLTPGASAQQVTVTAGDNRYTGSLQGNVYTVSIVARPEDMLVVDVHAPQVHFRSFLGSASLLRSRANGDGQLVVAEHSSLNASPYSTALALLVNQALGGRDATTDAEFDEVLKSVVGESLTTAAYSLAALADGRYPLPAGYADGLQLVQDEEGYRLFRGNPGLLDAAQAYLYEQADSAPLRSLTELPEDLLLMGPVPLGEIPLGGLDVMLLRRSAGATYDLHESVSLANYAHNAALDASGAVILEPVNPQYRPQRSIMGDQLVWESHRRSFRRLSLGNSVGVWVVKSTWHQRRYGYEWESPTEIQAYSVVSVAGLAGAARSDGWTSSIRALPWICEGASDSLGFFPHPLAECDYVLHQFPSFPSGPGYTVEHADKVSSLLAPLAEAAGRRNFTSVRDVNGVLTVNNDYANSTFWRLKGPTRSYGPVFYLSKGNQSANAGQSLVGLSSAITALPQELSPSLAVGNWHSSHSFGAPPSYPRLEYVQDIIRAQDGFGRDDFSENGTQTLSTPSQWQVLGDAFFDLRSRATFGQASPVQVRDCGEALAAGASTCARNQVRYFKPLLKTWDRYYGIEEMYVRVYLSPGQYTSQRTYSRPSVHACASGACMPNFVYPAATPTPAHTASSYPISFKPARLPAGVESAPSASTSRAAKRIIPLFMPIYAFQCAECGHSFDRLQKMSDPDPETCPACGAHQVKRQLTAPSFRLSGSGWYETDFKEDGDKKRNLSEGSEGIGKPDGKPSGDAKPAAAETASAPKTESKTEAKPVAPAAAPSSSPSSST